MTYSIIEAFIENPEVIRLTQKESPIALSSMIQEAIVIAGSYRRKKRSLVVVKPNLYEAQRLHERLLSFLPEEDCLLFSTEDSLRVEAIASSPELLASRIEVMHRLLTQENRLVITHATALTRQLPRPSLFKEQCLDLFLGQEIEPEELKRQLIRSGYTQVSHIDKPLCFASRGGVVDIYSMNYDYPIRLEFFDNEVDRLCFFDIETQRTIKSIEKVTCIPATDILFSEEDVQEILEETAQLIQDKKIKSFSHQVEMDLQMIQHHLKIPSLYLYYPYVSKTSHLLDYMRGSDVLCSPLQECLESNRHVIEQNVQYLQEMIQEGRILPRFSIMHDLNQILDQVKLIETQRYIENTSQILELDLPKESLDIHLELLKKKAKTTTILFCLQEREIKSVLETCIEKKIPYHLITEKEVPKKGINVAFLSVFEGFEAKEEGLMVITSADLIGNKKAQGRFSNKFKNAEVLKSYQDLNLQDYVVHNQHGVGQYLGIETREVFGIHKDFLKIIYRGNDELLVPLEQFRLVRKFVSREGVVPKLHKLGSSEWRKTKEKLKENVHNLAERLVTLYAARDEQSGYAYPEDEPCQIEFEEAFDYNLTKDQQRAVEEIKKDMMIAKPMDRLLCGDVGFGKTEVAIRAAFKAVWAGKQVAFLCPTTILSRQHAQTFMNRFKGYPVEIRLLNRFVPLSKQKQIIQDCLDGKVDILIGTHRLLGKDVKYRDLGLLVIDEEQRFGVEHKEKIKEIKTTVDVLSLSATPIPRTLQMSLIGIRQLSLLETPPNNRQSVQTYVVEKSDGLLKEVIEKELSRKGQVFYLHNNTQEIYHRARLLQELIPQAQVAVVHGQMGKEEIENVMLQFTKGEVDILLCTTIIETGIDIPNANTILVENAENFGLSQLYQIKGRVGRSNRLAYAYLMVPKKKQLSEVAAKRLQAIKDFTQLGSGYRIAMRDLTIRGAGDLLGPEQSGFIDTVGIDMYIEMLEEAINEKKGIIKPEEKERIKTNIQVDSYIPEQYTPNDYDKINMYQQIDAIETEEELFGYREKIQDEYGRLPEVVETVFEKRQLEIILETSRIDKFKEIAGNYELVFSKDFSDQVDGVKLFEMMNRLSKEITLKYQQEKIQIRIPKRNHSLKMIIELIKRSDEVRKDENR